MGFDMMWFSAGSRNETQSMPMRSSNKSSSMINQRSIGKPEEERKECATKLHVTKSVERDET